MCNGSGAEAGRPNIDDRSGRRQLPIGIESFEDVLTRFTYVDKSLVVRELVDRGGVTLYCRPRRFGKSTFLRMLQCFFECPEEGHVPDRRGLFDGLAIAGDDPRYMGECCAHPVIYLNLASCGASSYEETMEKVSSVVASEYARHRYLYDPGWMFPTSRRARPGDRRSAGSFTHRLPRRGVGRWPRGAVVVVVIVCKTPFDVTKISFSSATLDWMVSVRPLGLGDEHGELLFLDEGKQPAAHGHDGHICGSPQGHLRGGL